MSQMGHVIYVCGCVFDVTGGSCDLCVVVYGCVFNVTGGSCDGTCTDISAHAQISLFFLCKFC